MQLCGKMVEFGLKPTITNEKVDIENFNGRNNFSLWHSDIKDAMYMLDLDLILKETRPYDTHESDLERFNIKTCGYTFLQEMFANSLYKALENK